MGKGLLCGGERRKRSMAHLLLLFHRRPLVVGLNNLIGPVSRYGLDVPRLTVMVGEHCDRCNSEAVVCEMWLYTCSL